ncbi:chemotaxis protein CheB [Bermanella sp. WJH001]|uniref:chemotaxis protein CheB n=1 Tax=Bermanella sp. WJH001 TaxID=3048005 RepID=UPI0024BD5D26|nr:chemotaxis protein CheB [Bermanella sp. WJH001]MDJ1538994.1 chemotaxis protein CheB [Bermanella sp. WJH001]
MSEHRSLKLAVVAEDSLHIHRLRRAIEDFGCEVISLSPQSLQLKGFDLDVSAWLVDLREDDELLDAFCELEQPVLLGFEAAPSAQTPEYPRWEKRLYAKLKNLIGKDFITAGNTQASITAIEQLAPQSTAIPLPENLIGDSENQAQNVFVIGSSLGGPEAVKAFLDALPKGLPVGFIYGQHIDAQFVPVLAQVLGRHAHFKLRIAQQDSVIRNGEMLIVPADKEVGFQQGQVQIYDRPWPGPYGPSVDQLIVNTLKGFPQAGVILFSGMGNDGAEAVSQLDASRTQIWAQSSETCASAAMPDASRETGAVNFSGSPQQLAQHLVEHINQLETQRLVDTSHAIIDK